jgi:hypothetical protein
LEDDLEAGVAGEQAYESFAEERVVVDDAEADAPGGGSGGIRHQAWFTTIVLEKGITISKQQPVSTGT